IFEIAPNNASLTNDQINSVLDRALQSDDFSNKRILLILPDATRTAPIGPLFKGIHERLHRRVEALDLIIALGTHPPLSESAICQRLEITPSQRHEKYSDVRFYNHEWNNPAALEHIGTIPADEINLLSGGLFSMDVQVEINSIYRNYDILLVIGPVFPHEVVGFSGGNKYFFPGIAGPRILNFFHWLGAVVTNPMIIGNKWTPVRKVVDRAASLIPRQRLCFAAVVDEKRFAGLFFGTPESAWDSASDLSAQIHITRKPHPFHTVLSCAPPMYDELWVAGKCMYKLEPVVADGGELIIYAPHLEEISTTHGHLIRKIGYHCRDYFLKQWDRFKHYPWGVLAHSTHVHGIGTYENGIEQRRILVTLATRIPPEVCHQINLGWRNPDSIRIEDFADREDQGILLVPKAGERLFHLQQKPAWAGG
ncbi:MAG: lactate racemase domain-containing protein, partial [Chthoniobacterales bacterium]|nr:lactate racemase domain-containing protein [Chthoniobacterales bacterium]